MDLGFSLINAYPSATYRTVSDEAEGFLSRDMARARVKEGIWPHHHRPFGLSKNKKNTTFHKRQQVVLG